MRIIGGRLAGEASKSTTSPAYASPLQQYRNWCRGFFFVMHRKG